MLVFTHLTFANFFYWRLKKQKTLAAFTLDWTAFLYGNIKPDITAMSSMKHHLTDTHELYEVHRREALDNKKGEWKRSVALGVACHFLCDYFCKYHAKDPYTRASLFEHLGYEWKLHKVVQLALNEQNTFCDLQPSNRTHSMEKNKSLESYMEIKGLDAISYVTPIIRKLLEDYSEATPSMEVDMIYALNALNHLISGVMGIKDMLDTENDAVVAEVPIVLMDDRDSMMDGKVVA